MSLETPRLDDRAFNDIVEEARRRITLYCPEWTDHNLSDPGITLIELFSWMTDIILYRLNRVPEKNYIRFMELLGMRLQEAEPARAMLTFWLSTPQASTMTIPAGTEAGTVRTETEEAIVFSTDVPLNILVPKLDHIMTSQGGAGEGRSFATQNVRSVTTGGAGFPVFSSSPPRPGDALYLGFDQDISHHLLGVEFEVDTAEGAGVDPNNPPYVFEVLGSESNQSWEPVLVDTDTTLGLNRTGLIRLHLPAMRRALRNDLAMHWVRLRLKEETGSSYGVSPLIRRLSVSAWGGSVAATNVTRVRNEILGRSDGTPGQKFFLANTPIIVRTPDEYIAVKLLDGREERWTEVTDFSGSNANDRHYTLDSRTGEIRFGPALPQRNGQVHMYGAIPAKGAMVIMNAYRYGGGVQGNVAARTISILKTSMPYVQRVTNMEAATGGLNAEDIETAKTRVPGYLRSLRRAVTAADFEYLTREALRGEVGRVFCLQPPLTNRGEIKILIVPRIPALKGFISPESLEVSPELRDTVTAFLDERRLLSTQLEVMAPNYHWVETEVRFQPAPHQDVEKVRRAIEERLFDYLNPLTGGMNGEGWPFGRDLFVSDVMAVLLAVPGVLFVRSVKLFPVTYENGTFTRGAETQSLPLVAHGVVVSYRHTTIAE